MQLLVRHKIRVWQEANYHCVCYFLSTYTFAAPNPSSKGAKALLFAFAALSLVVAGVPKILGGDDVRFVGLGFSIGSEPSFTNTREQRQSQILRRSFVVWYTWLVVVRFGPIRFVSFGARFTHYRHKYSW